MVSKSLVIDIMADLGYCFYSALVQPPWSLLIPIRSIMGYKSADALATFLVHLYVVIFSLPFLSMEHHLLNQGSHIDSDTVSLCKIDHPHTPGHKAANTTVSTHSSSYRYYYADAWQASAAIVLAGRSPQHLSQWATGLTFSFLIIIIVINLVIN